MDILKGIDFFNVESSIWVANKIINVPSYDFKFEPLFHTSRPRFENNITITGRIGAIKEYTETYDAFSKYGFHLINTPEEHVLASKLEYWYPFLKDLTPKSKVYDEFPDLNELYEDFTFPLFIKGNRQTSKHNPTLSIAHTEDDFQNIKEAYKIDPILHWQKVVVREFIDLKPMEYTTQDKVQISYEFRTFWWKNELVGTGHYWSQYLAYNWSKEEEKVAVDIARLAVKRLNVPFIAIDLALTASNNWIIIECNDAQESGYCGVKPITLWKNIIDIEKRKL